MRLQFNTIQGVRFDSRVPRERADELVSELLQTERRIADPANREDMPLHDVRTFMEHRSSGSSTAFTRYPFTPISFLVGAMTQEEVMKERDSVRKYDGYIAGVLDINTLGFSYSSCESLHEVNLDIDDLVREEFLELLRNYVDGLLDGNKSYQGILYCCFKGSRTVTFEKGGKIEMPNMIFFMQWIPSREKLDLPEHITQGVKLKDYRFNLGLGDVHVLIDEFGVRFEQKDSE